MSVIVVIQARMGSTRFPGKSLAEINGKPILWYLYQQLSFCTKLDGIILATTEKSEDDRLVEYADSQGWECFRGDSTDVLGRYYFASCSAGAEQGTGIIRLTGDDILPDPAIIDSIAGFYEAFKGSVDYVSTDRQGRLPYGAGVELFSFRALKLAYQLADDPYDREHVSPFIRNNPEDYPFLDVVTNKPMDSVSLSIDYPEDLQRNARLIELMSERTDPPYHLHDILMAGELL